MGRGSDSHIVNAPPHKAPPVAGLIAAYGALYVIWGSTYLGMKFAVQDLPPFLMAGVRFVIAGSTLFIILRLRGTPRPVGLHWRSSAVIGFLLLVAGNGGVAWAMQHVPSGLAALLLGMTPCWMVLLDWLFARGPKPSLQICMGMLIAVGGVVMLSTVKSHADGNPTGATAGVDIWGAGALMLASLSWAAGSIYSRRAPSPASTWMSNAMQMLCGGVGLLIIACATEDWSRLQDGHISLRSLLALGYLIVFGSLIGFSAYVWLLRVSTPARVATYAYINPIVAVLLGWALAGEEITARTGLGALLIVAGVVIITLFRTRVAAPIVTAEKA